MRNERHTPAKVVAPRRWWPFAVLVGAALATYGNSLRNGFAWDDGFVILRNPTIRSLGNVGLVLTSPDVLGKGDPATYYRPLSRLSYVLEYQAFGLDPLPYHALSVLAHLAVVLLLFVVARRLLGSDLPAVAAALLLAVHPVNSEPVNLISGRNTLLAAACMLASYGAYLRGRDDGRTRAYVVAVLVYAIGLLCKETAVMLLPFLIVSELFPVEGRRIEALRKQAPVLLLYAMVAGSYLAIRAAVLPSALGGRPPPGHLAQALVDVLHAVPKYAATVLAPLQLTVLYRDPVHYFADPRALVASWIAILAVTAALALQRRPSTRAGLLWFGVNFIPVSTIVPFPSAAMADRFLYVPLIGVWLVLADQAQRLVEAHPRIRAAAVAIAAVPLVALGAMTFRRNLDWHDDVALFQAAVRAEGDSPVAHYTLGVAYMNAGRPDPARDEWRRTLQLDPRHVDSLSQLGTYHAERNEVGEAERLFRRVIELDDGDAEAHFNLALLLERSGRPADALAHYARFLETARGDSVDLVPRVRERMRQLGAARDVTR